MRRDREGEKMGREGWRQSAIVKSRRLDECHGDSDSDCDSNGDSESESNSESDGVIHVVRYDFTGFSPRSTASSSKLTICVCVHVCLCEMNFFVT